MRERKKNPVMMYISSASGKIKTASGYAGKDLLRRLSQSLAVVLL